MRHIHAGRTVLTFVWLLMCSVATGASPVLREYLEIAYQDGIPTSLTRRWEFHETSRTTTRITKGDRVLIIVVDRRLQTAKFWSSFTKDEVYVIDQADLQRSLNIADALRASVPPESNWQSLGEKDIAGTRCKGWRVPASDCTAYAELWADTEGGVAYSASFVGGQLVSQTIRLRRAKPSQSEVKLLTIPPNAKEKRLSTKDLQAILERFFGMK
jgi:hypothetical protein